jgi:serine phosphatase RsbU (regulator of sigma subunit)
MLPRRILVKKSRWVWIALMALSPLAYFTGWRIASVSDANMSAGFTIDRDQAITKAAAFAGSLGIDTSGWGSYCTLRPVDENLHFYYPLHSGPEGEIARKLAPPLTLGVVFRSPDKSENAEVLLSRTGEIQGYRRNFSNFRETMDPGEPASRKLAEARMIERLRSAGLQETPALKLQETSDNGIITRRYTYTWQLKSLEGLTIESILSTRGSMLVGDIIETRFERGYPEKHLRARGWMKTGTQIAYVLILAIVLILGIYRFVQRVKEKEVSFSRVAVLTGLFAFVVVMFILISDLALYDISKMPDFPIPDIAILLSSSMVYIFVSMFVGLAYGAGEGDIRESYPGKLTSLDAFLTGHFFSKNVAISLILGSALGGWVVLLTTIPDMLWQGQPASGKGYTGLELWFGYLPKLSPFLYWPMDTLLICVMGLLLPLPFLRRRFSSHRVIIPILFIFTWISAVGPYMNFRPWAGALLEGVFRAGILLLAFFYFDLLTAIITLAAPSIFSFSFALFSQPSPTLHADGGTALLISLIGLMIGIVFSIRGRFYREDEVRPVYARNLAERLSMQAEVSAARQAQLRLMPESIPRSEGLSIAAHCTPAFEVGGDFYDLFELEPGKIGVLMAEGGGKGLGSALSAAFAKGFLMPRIYGNGSGADDSPTEMLRSLEDRLLTMLENEAGSGLAYAVIDASDRTLRYARFGEHPAIIVRRGIYSEQTVPTEEREVRYLSNRVAGQSVRLIEGTVMLNEGDIIFFYTDGIEKSWKKKGTSAEMEFARVIATSTAKSVDLQEALEGSIKECAKRAKRQGTEDDLTAVIIKVESAAGSAHTIEGNSR